MTITGNNLFFLSPAYRQRTVGSKYFYPSLLLENDLFLSKRPRKDRKTSCNVRLPTCRWIQLGILFTSLFVLKRRRVRQVATNNTVLSAGSVQVVHDQGQVLFLWIRCRAIRRFKKENARTRRSVSVSFQYRLPVYGLTSTKPQTVT